MKLPHPLTPSPPSEGELFTILVVATNPTLPLFFHCPQFPLKESSGWIGKGKIFMDKKKGASVKPMLLLT
jgi:hypothetical protein